MEEVVFAIIILVYVVLLCLPAFMLTYEELGSSVSMGWPGCYAIFVCILGFPGALIALIVYGIKEAIADKENKKREEQWNEIQKQQEEREKIRIIQEQQEKQRKIDLFFNGDRVKWVKESLDKLTSLPNRICIFRDRIEFSYVGGKQTVLFETIGFSDLEGGYYTHYYDESSIRGTNWRNNNELFFFACAINKYYNNIFSINEQEKVEEFYMNPGETSYRYILESVDMRRPLQKY